VKIYSMTATFGKLENETLTLEPGLNIIEAPNEWGKSTWCAFLVAMLYGIETRVHTTKTALADKERYAPWSGSPMSGRMELCWNGRDITIERSTKGRSIFGVFRAYETHTGLEVPELTAANCGQMLLGVEKSVFLRAGFLKLQDLPVTQDDALRRRLNAIVTTGDESGTADTLAQKLKDLKNRCRLNRSNGLLPQAEAQRKELSDKLAELDTLRFSAKQFSAELEQLTQQKQSLENHRTALRYEANRSRAEKISAAQAALASAEIRRTQLEAACAQLPSLEETEQQLLRLRQLRDLRDSLHMDAQMLPQEPRKPEIAPVFRDLDPQTALQKAEKDTEDYRRLNRKNPFPWYCLIPVVLAAASVLIPHWSRWILCGLMIAAALILFGIQIGKSRRNAAAAQALLRQYRPMEPEDWIDAAQHFGQQQQSYEAELDRYRQTRQELSQRAKDLQEQILSVTQGRSLSECEQGCLAARQQLADLAAAVREQQSTENVLQALQASQQEVPAPAYPDSLQYSDEETSRLLTQCEARQMQLQQQLDRCQGRIEAAGQESLLRQQLEAVDQRIDKVNKTYLALELAQNTLANATAQLQRRFAPRISHRAQALFSKLTDGRYTRLTLGEDLSANASAAEESTLRSVLWRSAGTMDQLYLALRLAVSGELTPEAPLVLDDALVRFDDRRLLEALDVLTEEAESKQVILFTCQSRENKIIANQKG